MKPRHTTFPALLLEIEPHCLSYDWSNLFHFDRLCDGHFGTLVKIDIANNHHDQYSNKEARSE